MRKTPKMKVYVQIHNKMYITKKHFINSYYIGQSSAKSYNFQNGHQMFNKIALTNSFWFDFDLPI